MAEKINAGHAKNRALVAYPSRNGGTAHGRLLCVGGNRSAKKATILLPSGTRIVRPVDELRLVPQAPRVIGVGRQDLPEEWGSYVGDEMTAPRVLP